MADRHRDAPGALGTRAGAADGMRGDLWTAATRSIAPCGAGVTGCGWAELERGLELCGRVLERHLAAVARYLEGSARRKAGRV